jgi:hypothetical protein
LLLRIQELEEKLLETQLQLERVTDEKLTCMLSIQKSPTNKTGLGYVAPSSDAPSTSRTVFVKQHNFGGSLDATLFPSGWWAIWTFLLAV